MNTYTWSIFEEKREKVPTTLELEEPRPFVQRLQPRGADRAEALRLKGQVRQTIVRPRAAPPKNSPPPAAI